MSTSKVCIFHPAPQKLVCKVSPGLEHAYTSLCGMWCCLGLRRLRGRGGRHRGEGEKASQIPNSIFLQSYPNHSPNKQINSVINKSGLITFCMKSCWAIVGRKKQMSPPSSQTSLSCLSVLRFSGGHSNHLIHSARSLCILADPGVGFGCRVTTQGSQFWRLPREVPHSVLSFSWKRSPSGCTEL